MNTSELTLSHLLLSFLKKGVPAVVEGVAGAHPDDSIAQRLRDFGLVEGEPVRLVARDLLGADPLLIQINSTRFALRRSKAARITVRLQGKA